MTHSILDNTTTLFDCESTTDNGGTWAAVGSASAITANGDIFKVGSGGISAKLDGGVSGAKGGMAITRGTAIDFDDAGTRRGMLAVWCLTTSVLRDTATTGGITVRVGSDVSNYYEWQLATSDGSAGLVYSGGWARLVLDLNTAPDTTVGTPVDSACDYYEVNFDVSTDIMGNIQTIYIDQIDVLTAADIAAGTRAFEVRGTTVTAGSALSELAALTTVTDLGAIIETGNGSFSLNMPVKFGDTTASATSTITSTNEYLFIPAHRFGSGFCTIQFDGGTGTNTATWGAESGSGDNTLGAQGGAFVCAVQGSGQILAGAADHTTTFAGTVIDGMNLINWASANCKAVSCTFVNCGSILLNVTNGAVLRDSVVTDSAAATGVGAIILTGNPAATARFRDMLIQNCIHGIENEANGPITWDLRNIKTTNNTADIRFNHASGLLTVNVLEGSDTFTTSDGGAGGTISIVASQPVDITAKDSGTGVGIEGVEVRVEQTDGTLIVSGTTNSLGVFSDTTSYTGAMVYKLRKSTLPIPRYFAVRRTGTIVSETGFSTEVLMVVDTIAAQS